MKTKSIPESAFQSQVLAFARLHGWRPYHTHDSRRSHPGFPDLVLVRERVIWAELKSDRGKVSAEQQAWIDALVRAGQEVYVWRPEDWGEIEMVLGQRSNL
jgi:hypothetical protein